MKRSGSVFDFMKEVYQIWIGERPSTLAAALAYYSLFSFAPAIFIAYTIAGLFINEQQITDQLMVRLENTLGVEAAQYIQDSVTSIAQNTSGGSTLVSLIGFVALLLAASMLFYQLQFALNTVWKVPPPKKGGTLALMRGRLLAFGMVLGIGLLLILLTMLSVITSVIYSYLELPPEMPILNTLIVIGIGTVCFALMYKILPDVDIEWKDVWIGAAVTSVLVAIGIWLLGIYMGSARITSALEAAGVVAVLLITFYVMAQIFLFGAIFTRVYSGMYGSMIIPKHHEESQQGDYPDGGIQS
jgi:membrane protein